MRSVLNSSSGSIIMEYAITTMVASLVVVSALGIVGVSLVRTYQAAQFILSLPVP